MIKFLVTLKQKDLSAVSSEQILRSNPITIDGESIQLKAIDRFQLIYVNGEHVQQQQLLTLIKDSYIFSNPNKHHLIFSDNLSRLNQHSYYVKVSRKQPINLSGSVTKLNSMLDSGSVTNVHVSDIWSVRLDQKIEPESVTQHLAISSNDAIGIFAHPLVHDVETLEFNDFASYLNA